MPNTIQLFGVFQKQWLRRQAIQYRNSNGNLYVRYLYWNDDRWNWNNNWLDNNFNDNNPAALSCNCPHFSPYFLGEFFVSCPCQPPNIRPTSSSLADNATYLLFSRDLLSHNTSKRILRVSIFCIARLTNGSFSSLIKKLAVAIASIASMKSQSIF